MPTNIQRIVNLQKNDGHLDDTAYERSVLEQMVTHQSDYTESMKPTNQNKNKEDNLNEHKLCGKKVKGFECITLLDDCLSGNVEYCKRSWNALDWSNGVDFKDADYGAVLKLAKKIGLDTKTPEKVRDELNITSPTQLSDSVMVAFRNIKQIIDPSYPTKPVAPQRVPGQVMPRVPVVPSSGMVGGGSQISYANYMSRMNLVRNQLSLEGGGDLDYTSYLRASLRDLNAILQKNNKQIEPNDLNRINDAIDKLERYQTRVRNLTATLVEFRKGVDFKEIKVDGLQNPLTLRNMEDIVAQQAQEKNKIKQRVLSLTDIFKTIERLSDDVTLIKNKP